MPDHQLNIVKIFDNTWHWYMDKDGETFISSGNRLIPGERPISAAALSTLHPDLPIALKAMLKVKEAEGLVPVTEGCFLHETLRLLKYGPIDIYGVDYYRRTYTKIETVKPALSEDSIVWVGGNQVFASYVEHEGRKIPFVTLVDWYDSRVDKSVLEKEYPGWLERFKIFDSLGLDGEQHIRHLFKPEQVAPDARVSVEISNITFD